MIELLRLRLLPVLLLVSGAERYEIKQYCTKRISGPIGLLLGDQVNNIGSTPFVTYADNLTLKFNTYI